MKDKAKKRERLIQNLKAIQELESLTYAKLAKYDRLNEQFKETGKSIDAALDEMEAENRRLDKVLERIKHMRGEM